ncbi:hypothetical protein MYCTH_2113974 [Thermothelomyces thermophilus ATCC 42464]|uniref:Uncharacterized protein n=1 Tax=Thermothelomyces thermophilus (strain ATCC 42464 / BCRC 31852 / DSM 1799) TaxID=573729 RepID=G2QNT9_THET4|nr:uncharacterized protein MYCTH_2113974 [Thermothelomyces thermophilus ATCC 42464]AEO62115.1 hypothetical protein MYCTH_2113974 [Thermothelomyces thermophilus ATCC 42464]
MDIYADHEVTIWEKSGENQPPCGQSADGRDVAIVGPPGVSSSQVRSVMGYTYCVGSRALQVKKLVRRQWISNRKRKRGEEEEEEEEEEEQEEEKTLDRDRDRNHDRDQDRSRDASTFLLCAKGLHDQARNQYLGTLMFAMLAGLADPADEAVAGALARIRDEFRASEIRPEHVHLDWPAYRWIDPDTRSLERVPGGR